MIYWLILFFSHRWFCTAPGLRTRKSPLLTTTRVSMTNWRPNWSKLPRVWFKHMASSWSKHHTLWKANHASTGTKVSWAHKQCYLFWGKLVGDHWRLSLFLSGKFLDEHCLHLETWVCFSLVKSFYLINEKIITGG